MMSELLEINEDELLLLGLCRPSFSPELKSRLSGIAHSLRSWEHFVMLANEHGIAALTYKNLLDLDLLQLLDRSSSEFLLKTRILSLGRNAFHVTSAEEILSVLNREGIKVVLLKGLALEFSVFANCGLRQMTDIDLLVPWKDFLKARNALTGCGYESVPLKSGLHKPILQWTGKHLPSLLKNGLTVDIHMELFPGNRNRLTTMLIDSSSEIMIDREKAFIPSPRIFFLYLVRHLHQHELSNESQLRLYADLVFLLNSHFDEIINFDLLAMAEEAKMTKILAWKLEPLRDLWGIKFPEWIDDFIDRWFNPDSVNKFVFFLKSPRGNRVERPGFVYRQAIKDIPGIHRKLLFIAGDIFPSIRFMKERYRCRSSIGALLRYPLRLGKLYLLFSK